VVLIHGLFFTGLEMTVLGRRLKAAGLRALRFSYPSVNATPAQNGQGLAAFMRGLGVVPVHLVGHSLGGLVIRHALAVDPTLPKGRVVTMGTPHTGSGAARIVSSVAPGQWLLRHALEAGLAGDAPPFPADREVGCIAGDRPAPLSLGTLIPGIPSPSDGVVALSETHLAGCAAYLVLPVSHTGMIFDPTVATETAHFLRHGRFTVLSA
jgi:pimeloyl-ACP methyl ester carboxylesterase